MNERVVVKYPLLFEKEDDYGVIAIDMPADHRVLLVDSQHGAICLWAEVPVETPESLVTYRFRVFSTGQPFMVDDDLLHVGSTQIASPAGLRVWHLYREA